MTDIITKPFDWNDNFSEEALEDFKGIQRDLPYCTCQNIGMALAKLELLEKQGYKVIDPSGSSSEKPNKCEDAISRQAVLKIIDGWYDNNRDTENIEDLIVLITYMCSVNPQPKTGHWIFDEVLDKHYYCSECKSIGVDYWDYCPNCGANMAESEVSDANSN